MSIKHEEYLNFIQIITYRDIEKKSNPRKYQYKVKDYNDYEITNRFFKNIIDNYFLCNRFINYLIVT